MPRYKLIISYDGADFCGWQKQEPPADAAAALRHADPTLEAGTPGRAALRTVQAVVERAVREVVREPVMVLGSSRTDAGVHARGQVAAFTTTDDPQAVANGSGWPVDRGADRLLRAINGRLPEDVLVVGAEPVHAEFDPISDTISKGYSYSLHVGMQRPVFDRQYVTHVWEPLDLARMTAAADALVGEHDFAAFAAAGHGRLSTVRTVYECSIRDMPSREGGRRLRIDVAGSGFLWNMVRIIAGTLVESGKGRLSVTDIERALATGDRRSAGPTMPAHGLCLEWIRFKTPAPATPQDEIAAPGDEVGGTA